MNGCIAELSLTITTEFQVKASNLLVLNRRIHAMLDSLPRTAARSAGAPCSEVSIHVHLARRDYHDRLGKLTTCKRFPTDSLATAAATMDSTVGS
eukprot:6198491-Pleurochrysis_carterae.AAC.4